MRCRHPRGRERGSARRSFRQRAAPEPARRLLVHLERAPRCGHRLRQDACAARLPGRRADARPPARRAGRTALERQRSPDGARQPPAHPVGPPAGAGIARRPRVVRRDQEHDSLPAECRGGCRALRGRHAGGQGRRPAPRRRRREGRSVCRRVHGRLPSAGLPSVRGLAAELARGAASPRAVAAGTDRQLARRARRPRQGAAVRAALGRTRPVERSGPPPADAPLRRGRAARSGAAAIRRLPRPAAQGTRRATRSRDGAAGRPPARACDRRAAGCGERARVAAPTRRG
jgi:hypothetical protein